MAWRVRLAVLVLCFCWAPSMARASDHVAPPVPLPGLPHVPHLPQLPKAAPVITPGTQGWRLKGTLPLVTVGRRLTDGAEFETPAGTVTVAPLGVPSVIAHEVKNHLTYPARGETGTWTTQPTPLGLEQTIVLPNLNAPAVLHWQISSPRTGYVRARWGDIILVTRHGPFLEFAAPTATDSLGRAVRTAYLLSRDTLSLVLRPASRPISAPVTVRVGMAVSGPVGNWQLFSPAYLLANSKIYEETGRLTPNGCSFSATQHVGRRADQSEIRELALNDAACKVVLEEGRPMASPMLVGPNTAGLATLTCDETVPVGDGDQDQCLSDFWGVVPVDPDEFMEVGVGVPTGVPYVEDDPSDNGGVFPDNPSPSPLSAKTGTGIDLCACYFKPMYHHTVGYAKAYWQDPLHFDVNSVDAHVGFSWDYLCVHHPLGGYGDYGYFRDGWSFDSGGFDILHSCGVVSNNSYAHFHNSLFCHFSRTDTDYSPDEAEGHPDGTITQYLYSLATGHCTSLISLHGFVKQHRTN